MQFFIVLLLQFQMPRFYHTKCIYYHAHTNNSTRYYCHYHYQYHFFFVIIVVEDARFTLYLAKWKYSLNSVHCFIWHAQEMLFVSVRVYSGNSHLHVITWKMQFWSIWCSSLPNKVLSLATLHRHHIDITSYGVNLNIVIFSYRQFYSISAYKMKFNLNIMHSHWNWGLLCWYVQLHWNGYFMHLNEWVAIRETANLE